MRTTFIDSLTELAEEDESIWLLCGDLGFSVLERFSDRFPERYLNVGIAEQNMTGIAAGLALTGKTVFTYSIVNFATFRCLEQIRNDVCDHDANVKIIAIGGGVAYGKEGYTHQGIEDITVMSAFSKMGVVAPGDPYETRKLIPQIAAADGPYYVRLNRAGDPVVHDGTMDITLGQAAMLRDGGDLTFVATGSMLKTAVDTADALADEGIQARVLSLHTIKPLDKTAILEAAKGTGALVTVEEHSIHGGLGTMVADMLMTEGAGSIPFFKFGITEAINGLIGSQDYLRGKMGNLAAVARKAVSLKA